MYTGKIHKIHHYDPTTLRDYDSIWAFGQDNPKTVDIWHSDGTSSKIYVDNPVSCSSKNEIIIYDENRSRLKYIILISKSF